MSTLSFRQLGTTLLPLMLALLCGCSDKQDDDKDTAAGGKSSSGAAGKTSSESGKPSTAEGGKTGNPKPIGGGKSTAADVARKLGRETNFLIGMGNDLPKDYVWEHSAIYTLGTALDIHYIYLPFGWEGYNEGGTFAKNVATADKSKNTVPMATVYMAAGMGENNFDALVNDDFMKKYWDAAKLLFKHYGELDVPGLVHLEPDFWAYAQQKSGGDPAKVPVHLHPDCKDLPANVSGMARCWVQLAHDNSPKVLVGLHASEWGGEGVGDFLSKLGAAETDVVFIDILDRDAGCFEDGKLPQCKRGGKFYLDETNKTSPNYSERLDFAKKVSVATGKPIMWWQLPFGVPSDKPGGTPGHFRDNKVHYVFSHIQELVDAGGVGATFGGGAGEQTFVDTDGDQFKNAVKGYFAAPVPLP